MSDAERVEGIRKRVRLRERFGYSEIGYNGKTVFDAKDVPYLLDRIESLERERDRLKGWVGDSVKLHQAAADALPDRHGDPHRELVHAARQALNEGEG